MPENGEDTVTFELPAYAADTLGESLRVTCHRSWEPRVRALAKFLPYGPEHRRAVVNGLKEMTRNYRAEYTVLAYDNLLAAERAAGVI